MFVRKVNSSSLIELLLDSKVCVCNGRYDDQNNKWTCTCIKRNGTSVVDYFIVPIEYLKECSAFKVCTARDMISTYCSLDGDDINLSHSVPDHSVLLPTVNVRCYKQNANQVYLGIDQSQSDNGVTGTTNSDDENNKNHMYFQRYDVMSVPEQFMNINMSNE